jgi:hypothetical protein
VAFYSDSFGDRRQLVVARRSLGERGFAVGQTTFRLSWLDTNHWWEDPQTKAIIFTRGILLAFTLFSNRA